MILSWGSSRLFFKQMEILHKTLWKNRLFSGFCHGKTTSQQTETGQANLRRAGGPGRIQITVTHGAKAGSTDGSWDRA
jgi:hypothetical protein